MKSIRRLLRTGRSIRVIGFDDAPFDSAKDSPVGVAGVVCSGTRFEGMLWGSVQKDGTDATEVLATMLLDSKFYDQVHLVLIDGLALGGFNVIDLPELANRLDRPCVALMRKEPDMKAVMKALHTCDRSDERTHLFARAGEVHRYGAFYFQVIGETPEITARCLACVSDRGNVPEALRLAHLIGAAVITGQSTGRA